MNGTPDALVPLAEKTLVWVAAQRRRNAVTADRWCRVGITEDDLRRIELCAKVALEASMFHVLYGGGEGADAPDTR